MSKFSVGDWVRVTNSEFDAFDKAGWIGSIAPRSTNPYWVNFRDHELNAVFPESALTVADPDVHTVLDQMDAESALPQADLGPHLRQLRDITEQEIDGDYVRGGSVAPNRRAQVLRTAESLVNGQRADDYDPPAENFGRVAAMWSAQFATKLKEPLTADEVAIALVHLKLSRLANTPDHADSFIDAAGYIALAAEIAATPYAP